MKLKDLKPHQVAVVTKADKLIGVGSLAFGLASQSNGKIVFSVDQCSRVGANEIGDAECRLLSAGEAVVWNGSVFVLASQPAPGKPEGVHLSELKVGQLGRVLAGDTWPKHEIILRVPGNHYLPQFAGLLTGLRSDCFNATVRVQPYPMGSKIVPQPDGSIVVEEPEAKGLTLKDLEGGEFFIDNQGDLMQKAEYGEDYDVLTIIHAGRPVGGVFRSGEYPCRVDRRLTPAEAAIIIAKQ